MVQVEALLAELARLGIRVSAENGRLSLYASPTALTPHIKTQVRQHKHAIIAHCLRNAGAPPLLDLPTDFPRTMRHAYKHGRVEAKLAPQLITSLQQVAHANRVTLRTILRTAWQLLLHKHSGQSHIVVGDGARQAHTLLVESQLAFGRLVASVPPTHAVAEPCQVMFDCQQGQPTLPADLPSADYALTLVNTDQWLAVLHYNGVLFSAERAFETVAQYRYLLQQIALRPHLPCRQFSLVTTGTAVTLPSPHAPLMFDPLPTVVAQFAQQALRTPHHTALHAATMQITYGELHHQTDQLADYLQQNGMRTGDVVVIRATRCADLVAAALGVRKIGGIVAIVDANLPDEWLADYLQRLKPQALIQVCKQQTLTKPVLDVLARLPLRCRLTFALKPSKKPPNLAGRPDLAPRNNQPAFITTADVRERRSFLVGMEQSLVHFVRWQRNLGDLGINDRFALLGDLMHESLVHEMFAPLCVGATLCVPTSSQITTDAWLTWLRDHAITVALMQPHMAAQLQQAKQPLIWLRHLFLHDERAVQSVAQLRPIVPNATITRLYGVDGVHHPQGYAVLVRRTKQTQARLAGGGIDGAQLLVINEAGQLAGIGEVGDVWIRSAHVPLSARTVRMNGVKAMKTRDRGRFRPNGQIVLL